ncbi:MAG: hypothetical protein ACXVES_10790, partial [Actinomycetota bacterium]
MAEYVALESLLNDAFPERFSEPLTRKHAEFASTYMFRLLEAAIARCSDTRDFSPSCVGIGRSVDEMVSVLAASHYEVICCRVVSHLTTATGGPIVFGNFEIVPEGQEFGHLFTEIAQRLPGALSAFNNSDPRPYDPPHSLIVARASTDSPDPYATVRELSGQIERLLLIARLVSAGTITSCYEVQGISTLVSRMTPIGVTFRKGVLDSLVRRTTRLAEGDEISYTRLGELLDAANVNREGMLITSFDAALSKFNRSHVPDSAFEHVVDLATALEGVMAAGEKDTEGLTLRLRTRTAALLASSDDPGPRVFEDVGALYGLRSKLVHGGQVKESDLRKLVARISTVPEDSMFGIAVAHTVDRMRDIVRRA